jgi:hypothetical protein
MTGNVFQDAVIGRGLAAHVMLWLQAVDGDHDVQVLRLGGIGVRPLRRQHTKGASNYLYMDVAWSLGHQWHQLCDFAITHQRIATYDRKVQRANAVYNFQNARDEVITLVVGKRAQHQSIAAKVLFFICIAAGATQGTLPRNLDGKVRALALERVTPGAHDFRDFHCPH